MAIVWIQVGIFAISVVIVIILAIKRMRNDNRKDFENRTN
jgi:membrane protein implicated in regulation of membrane protease activity